MQLNIRPLSPHVGAQILDLDPRSEFDGASVAAPEAAIESKVGKSKSSGSGAIKKKAAAKKLVAKKATSANVAAVVAEAEPTI